MTLTDGRVSVVADVDDAFTYADATSSPEEHRGSCVWPAPWNADAVGGGFLGGHVFASLVLPKKTVECRIISEVSSRPGT